MISITPNYEGNRFENLGINASTTVNFLVTLGADKITAERDMKDVFDLTMALSLLRIETGPTYTAAKAEQIDIKTLKNK